MNGSNGDLALVTGGHGFLGSHLVDLLLSAGYRVRALLRPGRPEALLDPRVEVARGDLRGGPGLEEAADGASVVFHVAGLIAARGPAEFAAVNAEGTRRLARAAERAGCRRFLYVSSQAAAGPSTDGRALTEADPPRPMSHYGRSKLAGERALFAEARRMEAAVVRPPAIYGPGDQAILPFFRMASFGFAPGLEGPGRRFNLLHAKDVARGALAAGAPGAPAGVFFLSDGVGYGYPDIAAALAAAFGVRARRIPMPDLLLDLAGLLTDQAADLAGRAPVFGREKARELKARWWLCSADRARKELQWKPAVPLRAGMAETARWYAERGLVRGAGR